MPECSCVVLYTNGLIDHGGRDLDTPGSTSSPTCSAAPTARPRRPASGSWTRCSASTRTTTWPSSSPAPAPVPRDQIATWEVPSDPAAVADVRAKVSHQLAAWRVREEAFTTELILSELITNAIRYTAGPIRVRLIRDTGLICEVADSSSTAPHLRYAATTDEGGRGLFLVAQFAERWGTRYTPTGKVIWTEQALPALPDREHA